MIRTLSIALLGTVILPLSAMAQTSLTSPSPTPQSRFYLGGAVGQSTFFDVDVDGGGEVEFDFLGLFISGAVGYRLSPNIRAEAELLFESADIDNSSAETDLVRLTVSGYVDLAPTTLIGFSGVTPYVGGGAGIANVEFGSDDETEFTLHAEGGVSVPIANQVDFVPGFRLEYTFLDDDVFDDDLVIAQLRAGLRYSF